MPETTSIIQRKTLLDLPTEILCLVLGYLSPRDLAAVSLVCKQLNDVSQREKSDRTQKAVLKLVDDVRTGNIIEAQKIYSKFPKLMFVKPRRADMEEKSLAGMQPSAFQSALAAGYDDIYYNMARFFRLRSDYFLDPIPDNSSLAVAIAQINEQFPDRQAFHQRSAHNQQDPLKIAYPSSFIESIEADFIKYTLALEADSHPLSTKAHLISCVLTNTDRVKKFINDNFNYRSFGYSSICDSQLVELIPFLPDAWLARLDSPLLKRKKSYEETKKSHFLLGYNELFSPFPELHGSYRFIQGDPSLERRLAILDQTEIAIKLTHSPQFISLLADVVPDEALRHQLLNLMLSLSPDVSGSVMLNEALHTIDNWLEQHILWWWAYNTTPQIKMSEAMTLLRRYEEEKKIKCQQEDDILSLLVASDDEKKVLLENRLALYSSFIEYIFVKAKLGKRDADFLGLQILASLLETCPSENKKLLQRLPHLIDMGEVTIQRRNGDLLILLISIFAHDLTLFQEQNLYFQSYDNIKWLLASLSMAMQKNDHHDVMENAFVYIAMRRIKNIHWKDRMVLILDPLVESGHYATIKKIVNCINNRAFDEQQEFFCKALVSMKKYRQFDMIKSLLKDYSLLDVTTSKSLINEIMNVKLLKRDDFIRLQNKACCELRLLPAPSNKILPMDLDLVNIDYLQGSYEMYVLSVLTRRDCPTHFIEYASQQPLKKQLCATLLQVARSSWLPSKYGDVIELLEKAISVNGKGEPDTPLSKVMHNPTGNKNLLHWRSYFSGNTQPLAVNRINQLLMDIYATCSISSIIRDYEVRGHSSSLRY